MSKATKKLALLRVQLFTAMQELTGADLDEFWSLIDDVSAVRPRPPAPPVVFDEGDRFQLGSDGKYWPAGTLPEAAR